MNNTEIWASAERFLQMAIESVNDIASHIISEENLKTINQYRDLPEIFTLEGLINDELAEKMDTNDRLSKYSRTQLYRY